MAGFDGTTDNQPRLAGVFGPVLMFIEANLTAIAIGVLVFGVVVTVLGPIRGLIQNTGGSTASAEMASDETLMVGAQAGGALEGVPQVERGIPAYTIIPDRARDIVFEYTVQPGDTLIGIAEQFSITPETLVWANADRLQGDVHMLSNGMDLNIIPVNGVYHRSDETRTIAQIADKYNVSADVILDSEYNDLEDYGENDIPPWGMRIVVPGGEGEAADLWRPVIIETTDAVTGTVSRSFMPGMAGSCAAGIAGSGGSGAWSVPVANYAFTQPFYPGHSGVDLAGVVGTPVYAADSGVVIFSGWVTADWGYGVLVVLDHGNGWTSYYAHLNATYVSCGQFVSRGGTLGTMGSTGNSTGSHLHFEMRWNHTPDNPAFYIGF